MFDTLTGSDGGSGVRVNRKRALGHAAIWRGVNLIAGDVGRHPFRVYKYVGNSGLADDPRHQAALVMRRPNDYMTPFTFRQTLQAHALLQGNGYAYIVRDKGARPLELLPLTPERTWPVRVNGVLWYVTEAANVSGDNRKRGTLLKLPAVDVLHIKGLGFDGLSGYPVLKILRETIGGALAARDFGTRYFTNNATPGVVLEVPANMKDAAIDKLRSSWAELHQGVKKAHRPAILRDGVKMVPYTGNAKEAQLLENRDFDNRDVANILGVPPHKVGDPSRTAYNSLESENQAYHEDTLGRWFCGWEQEADSKLLTEEEKEKESHTCRFDSRPLSRVPLSQRGAYYAQGLQNGWFNVDEVRGFENLNPLPNGAGQVYRVAVNLTPIDKEQDKPADPPADDQAPEVPVKPIKPKEEDED